MLHKTLVALASLVLAVVPAYAQADRKNEIGLLLGGTVTPALEVAAVSPEASFLGSVGAIITFLITVSFLFTTPGVLDHSHVVPLLGDLGGFLIKDLALLGGAVWTAAEARGVYS